MGVDVPHAGSEDTCWEAHRVEDVGVASASGPLERSRKAHSSSRILGDPDHLKQLLLILTDNAVKNTPAGGRVSLAARRDNGTLRLEVSDTGVGIRPEDQTRIFERFYRADAARSPGGAGLGLAIARWIAEEHGGFIAVQSRPGQGSLFAVELPAAEPAATSASQRR